MGRIEEGLHNVHSEIRKSGLGVLPAVDDTEMSGDPFVRVNFVAPSSPADIAVTILNYVCMCLTTTLPHSCRDCNLRMLSSNLDQ